MRLLITGAWQQGAQHLDAIRAMGHETVFQQQEREPLACSYEWVEGVVCNGLFLHHPIEKFVNLKFIQLNSAGLDRVPMDHIRTHGIEIFNARGVYSIPMAEYAVGGVLQLYKQFPAFRESQKRHAWEKRRGLPELAGKTVCILGCGSIGSECARRFSAFGCRVTGIATESRQQPFFDRVDAPEELDERLREADVVVATLPLTDKTRHLLDEGRFAAMKDGAVLVNMARGAIADTGAMVQALRSGKLSGAVLDVFEEEPLGESSPLWNMENVLLTPHNSFVGDGVGTRLQEIIFGNLNRI